MKPESIKWKLLIPENKYRIAYQINNRFKTVSVIIRLGEPGEDGIERRIPPRGHLESDEFVWTGNIYANKKEGNKLTVIEHTIK